MNSQVVLQENIEKYLADERAACQQLEERLNSRATDFAESSSRASTAHALFDWDQMARDFVK